MVCSSLLQMAQPRPRAFGICTEPLLLGLMETSHGTPFYHRCFWHPQVCQMAWQKLLELLLDLLQGHFLWASLRAISLPQTQ